MLNASWLEAVVTKISVGEELAALSRRQLPA